MPALASTLAKSEPLATVRTYSELIEALRARADELQVPREGLAEAANLSERYVSKLLAPIPRPPRLRDFLCFELHVRQSRANRYLFGMGTERIDPAKVEIAKVWYERPVYYKGNPFSVVGHDAEVHWPSYSRIIDYELEIGRAHV